jgi:hypothetical protein
MDQRANNQRIKCLFRCIVSSACTKATSVPYGARSLSLSLDVQHFVLWGLESREPVIHFYQSRVSDPTEAKYIAFYWDEQRWSTAAIIISFPVFFFMARYIGQQITRNPLKRLSPVRRWLTYITLFVSSTALLGDTTTLIYNLLGGDLTIRFVLKVLVVAAIAGSGFAYYLLDLRQEERE